MQQGVVHAIGLEFALDGIARTTGSGPFRSTALDHESRDDTVESQTVVETLINQIDEIRDTDWCNVREKLDVDLMPVFQAEGDKGVSHNSSFGVSSHVFHLRLSSY